MASTSANPTVGDRQWIYDAFLSFRGSDTRQKFISHLYRGLEQWRIKAFIDNERLERGEEIKPGLSDAIKGSCVAIVVFSKDYASSRWCLDELTEIVEGTKSRGQTLIPIFYEVEPSDVRSASGSFGKALEEHKQKYPDKVQKWKDALYEASNKAGECSKSWNKEADLVDKIAQLVSGKIGQRVLLHIDNPVGLDYEIERVKPLLRIGEPEVVFVGIVGTGGIGKTTLAQALYNQFSKGFEGCSFLSNVKEASDQNGKLMANLQDQILKDLPGRKDISVSNVAAGITLIKERVQNRKFLIVLDDVDKPFQIEKLAGGCDWFGPGSLIIITTRDEGVLAVARVGASIHRHRMDILREDHARELLSRSAFGEPSPPTKYGDVFSAALSYAKGLPLALTVLGASLYNRDVSDWDDTIQELKKDPHPDIQKVLQISYNGLTEKHKAIFLDIACFFKGGEKILVAGILNGCGYDNSESGIRVLMERSLITSWDCWIHMHDLVEDMGKHIGKRSRLWLEEDIRSVLEDNTVSGTNAIQAICLAGDVFFGGKRAHIRLNPEAFKKMPNLRVLILFGCEFSCGPASLPEELRWLSWENYPSLSLPSDFNPRNLAGLRLRESRITELWDGQKMGPKLTVIDISWCKELREIPDVSGFPNLKELNVALCHSLVTVHESVGFLGKLEILSLCWCDSLKEFPSKLILPSLRYLRIDSCRNLEKFPDILGRMEYLETLTLSDISIKELPLSIENLTGRLQTLDLSNTDLEVLPRCIYHLPNLEILHLNECASLRGFLNKQQELEEDDDSCFSNLVVLDLVGNNIISLSPCITKCYGLKKLYLADSKRLKEIPELPPRLEYLGARNCESLETVGTQSLRAMGKIRMDFQGCYKLRGREESGSEMLAEWLKGHEERMKRSFPELLEDYAEDYYFDVLIPGIDIPVWDYHGRSGVGKCCLNFKVHSRVLKELAGFALFAAISNKHGKGCECNWLLKVNEVLVHERKKWFDTGDGVLIIYINLERHWEEEILLSSNVWNYFSFEAKFADHPVKCLKSSGVSFIGKSGQVFNSSTDIEFLGSETTDDEDTDEDIAEATTSDGDTGEAIADDEETDEEIAQAITEDEDEDEDEDEETTSDEDEDIAQAMTEDEDIAPQASMISGVGNHGLAAGGSSSISQPQPLEMQPPQKRTLELPPGRSSLSLQPSEDEHDDKNMKG